MSRKHITKSIFYLLGIFIMFFLGKNLYENWNQISKFDLKINMKLLVSSLIVYIIYLFCMAIAWNLILRSLKVQLSYKKAIGIFYLSQLARYLPGGVLNLFGRVYLARKEDIDKTTTVSSLILEMFFNVFSGGIISLFFLSDIYRTYTKLFIVTIVITFFIVLDSRLVNIVLNLFSRKLGNEKKIQLDRRNLLIMLTFYTTSWLIFGIAFVLFTNSVGVHGNIKILISIFPSSWIVGFLSPIPGGIGIREGILKYFLSFYYDVPIPVIVSLSSRLWLIVGEIIASGIALIFSYKHRLKFTKSKYLRS